LSIPRTKKRRRTRVTEREVEVDCLWRSRRTEADGVVQLISRGGRRLVVRRKLRRGRLKYLSRWGCVA
jgi:hypothetical protein